MILRLLDGAFAVCRLEPGTPAPRPSGSFWSLTHAGDERSLVCAQEDAPRAGATVQGGWRMFVVDGPMDLSLTGVMASLATPLAEAGVPLFAIATFDTDWLLVPDDHVGDAVIALVGAGHQVM